MDYLKFIVADTLILLGGWMLWCVALFVFMVAVLFGLDWLTASDYFLTWADHT